MTEVFIVAAARSAIGSFGGSLKDQKPGVLAALVVRAAIERAGVESDAIGHFVLGNVMHTEPRDAYAGALLPAG